MSRLWIESLSFGELASTTVRILAWHSSQSVIRFSSVSLSEWLRDYGVALQIQRASRIVPEILRHDTF